MPEWIKNTHAEYAIAAYIIAAIALTAVGIVSWYAHRRVQRTLQKLSGTKNP